MATKKRKAETQKLEAEANEGNVIIQFTTSTGEATGRALLQPALLRKPWLGMLPGHMLSVCIGHTAIYYFLVNCMHALFLSSACMLP